MLIIKQQHFYGSCKLALIQISEPGQSKETQESNQIIIGIDLGTTNSLVGITKNNKVEILTNENGDDMISSIVNYNDDGSLAGVGKNIDADIKISSIKRLMGKNFDDVKNEKFSFPIIDDKVLRIGIGARKIRPEEISGEILKYLKNIAEKKLGTAIYKAVITVPAYFDEAAKNATKLAANLADLEVVRLVNEPTAAALAYGLENSSQGLYCVYDLGGGTFDVSILKMQTGVFKVLGVAGDNQLGGDDFDDLIVQKFPHLSKIQARKIKEELSSNELAGGKISSPNKLDVMSNLSKQDTQSVVGGDSNAGRDLQSLPIVHVNINFTYNDFENLIAQKIEKTIKLTTNLIDDLELEAAQIKGVILVGGSTRIPLIRKKLAEIFGAEKILTNLDPDRVVAMGAALQANNLSGNSNNLLLDVNPLSLGIEMMGGITEKIIHRNSSIPTAYAKEFTTYADNQTGMKFHIVQGERELAKDCRSLANFEIKGIPAMKAGMARVLITFKLDADGLLTVMAEEKITKIKQEIEVKPSYHLDQNQVKEMLLDSIKNSQNDITNRLLIEAATDAMQDVVIIQNDLKNSLNLIDENEQKLIEEKLKILEKEIKTKTSKDAILLAQGELSKAAENLVLRKVNMVLKEKIAGKKIEDVC